MDKGERISQFVTELGGSADLGRPVPQNPFYLAFFECWNAQRYYEAHDVLEHLWLRTDSNDSNFFKGLIQAAGGFVHLKLNYEQPEHPKHGRRLRPAVRLFALAETNLEPYAPRHHELDVAGLLKLVQETSGRISDSDFSENPWSPERAPRLSPGEGTVDV